MVEWGNYAEAYRAIHDKLEEILAKLDYPSDPAVQDVINRADRLLGIIYGDVGQLLQRTTTRDLLIQLRHAGTEVDPRQIRALTSSDVVTVEQPTPTNFKATITPSGDMARKVYYDRNPNVVDKYIAETLAPHTTTERWKYTCPTGKKALHQILYGLISTDQVQYSSGIVWEFRESVLDTWKRFGTLLHDVTSGTYSHQTIAVPFILIAGQEVRVYTYNDDNRAHHFQASSMFVEFDE